ncbi:hypothetical protein Ancab_018921 [Ancistrocladus abbreviatus]
MTCSYTTMLSSPSPKSNAQKENQPPTPIISEFPQRINVIDNMKSSNLLEHSSTLASVVTPTSKASVCCSLKRKRPPKIQIPDVLRVIKVDTQLNLGDSPSKDDVVFFGNSGVGVSSIKGKKKFMEDTHAIVSSLNGNSKKGFFGVYDGHGGRKAAEFVAENLHVNIMHMLEKRASSVAKEEAVKAGYLKTDEEFLKQGVGSGTCCVTALIEEEQMVISNLGDCRAVLCRGGVAEALTKDHRAEQEDERKRIEDKGGYVEIHRGAWRVHGILSVSRSIGDGHLKDWIVAEPDTKILNLTPDMEFLVLASDGLWEEVGNQEAVDIVLRSCLAAKKLGTAEDLSKENNNEYACVNSSSSPKVRRVSLLKQPQKFTSLSPTFRKTINNLEEAHNCDSENDSPPLKLRRISLFQHNNMRNQSPSQDNKRQQMSGSLTTACKELLNLAVSRGSLDDITVMIIDLNHFRE